MKDFEQRKISVFLVIISFNPHNNPVCMNRYHPTLQMRTLKITEIKPNAKVTQPRNITGRSWTLIFAKFTALLLGHRCH